MFTSIVSRFCVYEKKNNRIWFICSIKKKKFKLILIIDKWLIRIRVCRGVHCIKMVHLCQIWNCGTKRYCIAICQIVGMPRLSPKKYIATYSVINSQIEVTINAFGKTNDCFGLWEWTPGGFFVLAIANVVYFFRNSDLSC